MLTTESSQERKELEFSLQEGKKGKFLKQTRAFEIRVAETTSGETVILKYARRANHSAQESLQRQYLALQELQEKAGNVLGDSLPRPVLLGDDVLITSALAGVPLTKVLRRRANILTGWRHTGTFLTIGREIGRWLRNFQKATRSQTRASSLDVDLLVLHERAFQCRNLGISENILASVLRKAECIAANAVPNLRLAACHGEFLPQNILVHGTCVAVVDFDEYRSEGSPYEDTATFVGYCATLASKVKYSRQCLLALIEGVLVGNETELDVPALRFHVLDAILRLAVEHGQRFHAAYKLQVERALRDVLEEKFPLGRR